MCINDEYVWRFIETNYQNIAICDEVKYKKMFSLTFPIPFFDIVCMNWFDISGFDFIFQVSTNVSHTTRPPVAQICFEWWV